MSRSTLTTSGVGRRVDPFAALVDCGTGIGSWTFGGFTVSERVARYAKGWMRRRLIGRLREAVIGAGGVWMRVSPFPYPYRSAFSFRADLDESVPEDYHRFAAARGSLGPCSTHFVSTYAYTHHQSVLDDLKRHDTQSHGHFHHVYRERGIQSGESGAGSSDPVQLGVRAGGVCRAARPMEREPRRTARGSWLSLFVRLSDRLRRFAVLPVEGRPILAGAANPGASGVRRAVPGGRSRSSRS